MSLVEIIFRPISLIFLIPTVLLLMVIAMSFWQPAPELANSFDTVCENAGLNLPIISGYTVPLGTFLTQFISPKSFTLDKREFKYYSEALEVLELLYNPSKAVSEIDFTNSKQATRKNYGYLRRCDTENCICHVNPGINGFSLIEQEVVSGIDVQFLDTYDFEMASCFHLMYNYEPARANFTQKFNELKGTGLTNDQLFTQSFNYTKYWLNITRINYDQNNADINRILNCIEFMDSKKFTPKDVDGSDLSSHYFVSEDSIQYNVSGLLEDFFENYYNYTSASLFYEILDCEPIPNENDCIHTKDVRTNYLTYSPQEYNNERAFIFYMPIYPAMPPTIKGRLNKQENLIDLNVGAVDTKKFLNISAGVYHTCGILTTGEAVCWGYNEYGQLGNGESGDADRNVPVYVSGNYNFSAINAGSDHTCGILTDGKAVCWGWNDRGQLGDGTTTDSNIPVYVSGGYTFKSISASAGYFFTCGVLTTGEAVCWGDNAMGQLGTGGIIDSLIPVYTYGGAYYSNNIVNDRLNLISISAGYSHACGTYGHYVTLGGGHSSRRTIYVQTGYCWGYNYNGQLGDGTTTDSNTPIILGRDYAFSSISAGGWHTCGLLSDGKVMCWGLNGNGRLGEGTTIDSNIPVYVSGGYTFKSISAGMSHTCGLLSDGKVMCWGWNSYGPLGDGTTTESSIPVPVSGEHIFSSISAKGWHTCGILTDGKAVCWGYNSYGQLGDGTNVDKHSPTILEDLPYLTE